MKILYQNEFESPIGEITFLDDGESLCFMDFSENTHRLETILKRKFGPFQIESGNDNLGIGPRLEQYVEGNLQAFAGISLNTPGTDFQTSVWSQLQKIPPGKVLSYNQLAAKLSNPKAIRAAGTAKGSNPVAIVIPCHRVIGKDGSLRGYAGGEWRKQWLLNHEGYRI